MTTPERLTAKTRPRRGGSIKLLATLGAAAGLTMPVQAERKVFILAGQSNMEGAGAVKLLGK